MECVKQSMTKSDIWHSQMFSQHLQCIAEDQTACNLAYKAEVLFSGSFVHFSFFVNYLSSTHFRKPGNMYLKNFFGYIVFCWFSVFVVKKIRKFLFFLFFKISI